MNSQVSRITLQKALIAARHEVDPRALSLAQRATTVVYEGALRELIMSMHTYVMAMPDETIEIHRQYPADWWQAFKERWFPEWAKDRWPVCYERIDVSERRYKAVCPHIEVPDQKECMRFFYKHMEKEKATSTA